MTSSPPPLYSPVAPFWMASWMVDQQIRMMQIVTDAMLRANPWLRLMLRAGGVDPLTADAAIGKGDETGELDLEAGGAEAEVPRASPQVVVAAKPVPEPAEMPRAEADPAPKAAGVRKRATPAPRRKTSASAPRGGSRARRKPAAPPPLPGSGSEEPKK